MKHTKIAIIGVGNVGAATAFALLLRDISSEIILIDTCKKRAEGHAKDLSDAQAFSKTSVIRSGTYTDACDANIVIVSAGVPQQQGQSRKELLTVNKAIIADICSHLQQINQDAIVIIVTNPLDTLTYLAQQLLPLPKNRIFGTGTWLDTQRLRRILGQQYHVSPCSIDAYMIGEHGDSAVAIIPASFNLSSHEIKRIQQKVIQEVYTIIDLKCATYYGIAACISDICTAILYNQRRIMPVSIHQSNYDICMSMPAIIGENGVERTINMCLNEQEQSFLEHSITVIRESTL